MNTKWRHRPMHKMTLQWLRAFHKGWVDRQNGRGWPSGYEMATKNQQIAYETGRLHLINTMRSGLPIPMWDGSRAMLGDVPRIVARAAAEIGNPVPPEFVEAPTITEPTEVF